MTQIFRVFFINGYHLDINGITLQYVLDNLKSGATNFQGFFDGSQTDISSFTYAFNLNHVTHILPITAEDAVVNPVSVAEVKKRQEEERLKKIESIDAIMEKHKPKEE